MKQVIVHLSNGEEADIKLLTSDINSWIENVSMRGITTKNIYIPYHSIIYIQFEDIRVTEDEDEIEVEVDEDN